MQEQPSQQRENAAASAVPRSGQTLRTGVLARAAARLAATGTRSWSKWAVLGMCVR